MNISLIKTKLDIKNTVIGGIFFLAAAFTFYLYSINFSLLVLIAVLFIYLNFFRKSGNLPSLLDLATLAVIAILVPLITTIVFKIPGYGIAAIGFIILITLLFENLELSFIFSILISFLAADVSEKSFSVALSLFIASIVAALLSYRIRRRFQVIRAGFLAGIVQFIVAYLLEGKNSFLMFSSLDWGLLKVCLANGILSPIIVLGILPIFEYIFKVLTNISLLELSDFNHPLMRRLILEAPGTYQHSLVMANLSEAAAESIGANSLLVRVGAYYHDIGKLVKPQYFIENLVNYKDMHKKLKPSMSKLIIFNHVKEGVELAKKYHINPQIINFIRQHHGKTLVYYFYSRAKEIEPDQKHEEEYKYPGPKPQSKEIAIVALADSIEAISRTVSEPNPARIEEMVREVVKKRFLEGELDESSLTLKDLEKITQSFIRILNATYHTRIKYPKENNNFKKK
ncbi:MAG: HDIG domain-containing protein [Candidatus Omnitrophica bacterium]|nr:HDIG domain-containing protein [Candidatus Omnitrophota bacterium]MCF7877906.1 HDIG domain-containing protein [Candidatus Omnitrophota bacterium]MCF7893084.1 HDIG domain-containing protein [Candidatus Omnitrophota bacterium]